MMQFRPISHEKWPSPTQRLLLRAALVAGDAGLRAWRQWNEENDIESLDSASFFILPQVYRNLKEYNGGDVPEYDRLKGVYRWTWSQNQLTLAGLADVLRRLHDAQIPAVVLKGIPLALHYYKDFGARMMKDADLFVDVEDVPRVIAALDESRWRQENPRPSSYLMPYLEAIHYVHPRWHLVDIHWRPFRLDTPAMAERKLVEHSREDRIGGVPTRTPSATDLLLLTCFHSRKADIHSTCRGVVDSLVLIRESEESIDWDRLLEYSQQLGLLLPVRDALSYLHAEFAAPIPVPALEHAWSLPSSQADQDRYRQMIKHGVNPSIRGIVQEHWMRYGDACRLQGRDTAFLGFVRYFLCHCRREIRIDSVLGLARRFTWGRFGRSQRSV